MIASKNKGQVTNVHISPDSMHAYLILHPYYDFFSCYHYVGLVQWTSNVQDFEEKNKSNNRIIFVQAHHTVFNLAESNAI